MAAGQRARDHGAPCQSGAAISLPHHYQLLQGQGRVSGTVAGHGQPGFYDPAGPARQPACQMRQALPAGAQVAGHSQAILTAEGQLRAGQDQHVLPAGAGQFEPRDDEVHQFTAAAQGEIGREPAACTFALKTGPELGEQGHSKGAAGGALQFGEFPVDSAPGLQPFPVQPPFAFKPRQPFVGTQRAREAELTRRQLAAQASHGQIVGCGQLSRLG